MVIDIIPVRDIETHHLDTGVAQEAVDHFADLALATRQENAHQSYFWARPGHQIVARGRGGWASMPSLRSRPGSTSWRTSSWRSLLRQRVRAVHATASSIEA